MQEEIKISASEEKGWLGKIKDNVYENWQTILVALVVLIVGVSAYNYNADTDTEASPAIVQEEESENMSTEDETAADQEEDVEEQDQEDATIQDQSAPVVEENVNNEEEEVNEEEETKTEEQNINTIENIDDGYKITATKGDGITHLARKAIARYLSENADDEVTDLHKIYIEDYLQNRIGTNSIEIGDEHIFTKTAIEEAITSSKGLSQESLNNLKKYEINIQ